MRARPGPRIRECSTCANQINLARPSACTAKEIREAAPTQPADLLKARAVCLSNRNSYIGDPKQGSRGISGGHITLFRRSLADERRCEKHKREALCILGPRSPCRSTAAAFLGEGGSLWGCRAALVQIQYGELLAPFSRFYCGGSTSLLHKRTIQSVAPRRQTGWGYHGILYLREWPKYGHKGPWRTIGKLAR